MGLPDVNSSKLNAGTGRFSGESAASKTGPACNPNLRQGGAQIARHDLRAAFKDRGERRAARQFQADLRSKRGQARLFKTGAGGRAAALDGVTDRAFQLVGVEATLDEVIRGAGLHGGQVHLLFAQTGENDYGRAAVLRQGRLQQFHSVVGPETVIHQTHIVLVAQHGLQAGFVGVLPT